MKREWTNVRAVIHIFVKYSGRRVNKNGLNPLPSPFLFVYLYAYRSRLSRTACKISLIVAPFVNSTSLSFSGSSAMTAIIADVSMTIFITEDTYIDHTRPSVQESKKDSAHRQDLLTSTPDTHPRVPAKTGVSRAPTPPVIPLRSAAPADILTQRFARCLLAQNNARWSRPCSCKE